MTFLIEARTRSKVSWRSWPRSTTGWPSIAISYIIKVLLTPCRDIVRFWTTTVTSSGRPKATSHHSSNESSSWIRCRGKSKQFECQIWTLNLIGLSPSLHQWFQFDHESVQNKRLLSQGTGSHTQFGDHGRRTDFDCDQNTRKSDQSTHHNQSNTDSADHFGK